MIAAKIAHQAPPVALARQKLVWLLVIALAASGFFLDSTLKTYPSGLTLPFADWVRGAVAWLVRDEPQIPGLPSVKAAFRAVASVFDLLLGFCRNLLSSGFRFTQGAPAPDLPPVPWFLTIAILTATGYRLGGRGLALLTFVGLFLIAATGNWASAMLTLASVMVAAAASVLIGLLLGIQAYRRRGFDRALAPVLDLMQTVPVFAYLIPVLMLVGFGSSAGVVATIIYATPPMIRNVVLGLRRVPAETGEFGRIVGCTPFQFTWLVMVPSALPAIMVGVNQVIMMSLNMVIIASMIGAGGLGYDVLTALRRLDIGTGLEAGLAIVALAIILDRQSQALARQTNDYRRSAGRGAFARHRTLILGAAAFAAVYLAACIAPQIASYPADYVMSARSSLNNGAKWITFNLSGPLDQIKTWFLLYLLIPFKTYIVGLPWFVLPALAALAGWKLSGPRLAAFCLILLLAIFVAGLQGPALTTLYLCGVGTLLSVAIGVPLGILGARNATSHKVLNAVCDTLQTLPSFVYLIPVVMLFKVGDFSALVAIVAYAVVPSIRYTDLGIRNVAHHMIEAGRMTGCTPLQILRRIELPLATPELILGISQTVMMALSMLVITALVGTRDLGQETYIALSKADAGRGLVAGFAIAFMAMVADRLLTAWSRHRCRQLGLT